MEPICSLVLIRDLGGESIVEGVRGEDVTTMMNEGMRNPVLVSRDMRPIDCDRGELWCVKREAGSRTWKIDNNIQ